MRTGIVSQRYHRKLGTTVKRHMNLITYHQFCLKYYFKLLSTIPLAFWHIYCWYLHLSLVVYNGFNLLQRGLTTSKSKHLPEGLGSETTCLKLVAATHTVRRSHLNSVCQGKIYTYKCMYYIYFILLVDLLLMNFNRDFHNNCLDLSKMYTFYSLLWALELWCRTTFVLHIINPTHILYTCKWKSI